MWGRAVWAFRELFDVPAGLWPVPYDDQHHHDPDQHLDANHAAALRHLPRLLRRSLPCWAVVRPLCRLLPVRPFRPDVPRLPGAGVRGHVPCGPDLRSVPRWRYLHLC